MRWPSVLLATFVIVSACSSSPQRPPIRDDVAPELTSTPAPPRTVATPPGPHDVPQVLLLDWPTNEADAEEGARLRPIDPATAENIEGYEPFAVEIPTDVVMSPDGRRAVAGLIPVETQYAPDAAVHLLDLPSWTMREVTGVPHGLGTPGQPVWHPDSRHLYAIESSCAAIAGEGACLEEWRHAIWVIDAESATGRVLTTLDFWTDAVRVAADGSALYLLAHRGGLCCGIDVEGDPFIAVVDTATGSVGAQIPLPGLVLGQHIEGRPGMPPDWEWNVQRWPGFAVAPDGARAYVAHSDDDRITVVDLEDAQVVSTVALRPSDNALQRFGGWLLGHLATRAEAKGGLTFRTQAELSNDGRYLFVTGTRDEACLEQQYFACATRPLGLRVLDTASMSVIRTFEDVTDIAVTSDGKWIAAIGYHYDGANPNADGTPRYLGRGGQLIDITALDIGRIHVSAVAAPGATFHEVATSPDGRYVYFHSYVPPEDPESTQPYRSHVDVFDIATYQLLGRDFEHGATRVIATP